jgi:hypothetical protein
MYKKKRDAGSDSDLVQVVCLFFDVLGALEVNMINAGLFWRCSDAWWDKGSSRAGNGYLAKEKVWVRRGSRRRAARLCQKVG